MSPILCEYLALHDESIVLYGIKTVLLMEVGSFFEIYAVHNDTECVGADIYNVCDLFNIQVTRKNKSITEVDRSNHLMAGFPNHSAKKFIDILISHQYTVVIAEQTTPPPKSVRKITRVLSPSTYIDEIMDYNSNNMMVVYFERTNSYKSKERYVSAGWSIFDASTGNSICNEINNLTDETVMLDEVYRIMNTHDPKEVLITSKDDPYFTQEKVHGICAHLDVYSRCLHNRMNHMESCFETLSYQTKMIQKVFVDTGMMSPIEYLDLEYKQLGLISFVNLIQFVYEHNEQLLTKIGTPTVNDNSDKHLLIAYNASQQLNLCPRIVRSHTQNVDLHARTSVMSIMNTTSTSVGKRYFKQVMLNPIFDKEDLTARYELTQSIIDSDILITVSKNLLKIRDIERLNRRMVLGTLHPHELCTMFESLRAFEEDVLSHIREQPRICKFIKNVLDDTTPDEDTKFGNGFIEFQEECTSEVDLTELAKYGLDSIRGTIFRENKYPVIDSLVSEMMECRDSLNNIINTVNIRDEHKNWMKLESTERDGYHLVITSKRWSVLQKLLCDDERINSLSSLHSASGASVKLSSDFVKNINRQLWRCESDVKELNSKFYKEFLVRLGDRFQKKYFDKMIKLLERIDFHVACAKNALSMGLSKPSIDHEAGDSFVEFEDLRHPIIEHVQKNVMYTPNSIRLGGADRHNGLILYGVNSSGKSSFMKSIGIGIILAQAGMFVPCKSMRFSPYKHVFTRIQSTDDILNGVSTFCNELNELRSIFKRANHNSLIIGDELCSGTESVSAVSIVTAGIQTLVNKNSTFIFATHLHELNSLDRITKLVEDKRITIQHLAVSFDSRTNKLVYDRILKEGPGSSLYGLEVCKSMDMDSAFIHLAGLIRHELLNGTTSLLQSNKSRYNATVICDSCEICKSRDRVETHHIRFQKDASAQTNMIDNHFHKNAQFNLVPLCSKCHDNLHNDSIQIYGWVQTSDGVKLNYKKDDKKK
jgi:DNA mismatch repair protein MutS